MIHLESEDLNYCVIVVLLKGSSPHTFTLYYAWTITTMMILWLWMKDYSHEHTMDMMWKVYSRIDGSKVEKTFSPNESMRYYDVMLVGVPSAFFHEHDLK